MVRKVFYGLAILAVSFGVAFADDFPAIIKKVEEGKVTFAKFNRKEKKISEEETLPAAKNIKVVKAKFNKETKSIEAGDDLPDGLKNPLLKEIGKKGVFAVIVTDDDGKKITELRVFSAFKKKKKEKD